MFWLLILEKSLFIKLKCLTTNVENVALTFRTHDLTFHSKWKKNQNFDENETKKESAYFKASVTFFVSVC